MDNKELSLLGDRESIADELLNSGYSQLNLAAGVSQGLDHTIERAIRFFSLDLEQKFANSLPESCGYRPMGIEYSARPDHPDAVESFSFSHRAAVAANQLHPYGQALWKSMERLFRLFEEIAETALSMLTSKYGSSVTEKLRPGIFRDWSRLQINLSRPAETIGLEIHEMHEDGDFFTIATATGPGLEIQKPDKSWLNGPESSTNAIILPGRILQLLSGGDVSPAYHRVVPYPELPTRIAVMFFGDIDPSLCAPWKVTELNAKIDIGSLVAHSVEQFGLKGFSSN